MQFKKYMARIPIVPDDFENQNVHKNHELVMDFTQDDLYVKKDDGYVNITGKIKEDIKQIADGSAVIHLVTEKTLPQIEDRRENHWYYVITRSGNKESGEQVSVNNYIYYGLIDEYNTSKNYLLIGQNMTDGEDTIQFDIVEGYSPCLYIPVIYNATFINHETEEIIDFYVKDRVYALDTFSGTYNSYDVYVLDLTDPGQYLVDIQLTGINSFFIYFDVNVSGIQGLVLPETMTVENNQSIGYIPDPSDEDPRYDFVGWSLSKYDQNMIIDTQTYIPEENMTLYAWYNFNENVDDIPYYGDQTSAREISFTYDPDIIVISWGQFIVIDIFPSNLYKNPGDPIGQLDNPVFHVVDENNETIQDHSIEFFGWCSDINDPNTVITSNDIVDDNMILYAIFRDTTLSYDEEIYVGFDPTMNQPVENLRVQVSTPSAFYKSPGSQIGPLPYPYVINVINLQTLQVVTNHNIHFVGWCTDLNNEQGSMVLDTDILTQDLVLHPVFAERNDEEKEITLTIYLHPEMTQEYLNNYGIIIDNEFPITIVTLEKLTVGEIIQNYIQYHRPENPVETTISVLLSTNGESTGYSWWLNDYYALIDDMILYVIFDHWD